MGPASSATLCPRSAYLPSRLRGHRDRRDLRATIGGRRTAIGVGDGRPGADDGRALVGPAVVAGLGGDVVVGGRGVGCGHVSGDRGGPEALDDQPDAERELPGGDRQARSPTTRRQPGRRRRTASAMTEARSSGAPMSPSIGMIRGTSRDRYIKEPSSRALMAGMRALPEQERPVVDRDVRRAGGDERGRIRSGGPACRRVTSESRLSDAGEDHGGFQDAGGDEAERDAFVLPLDHRVQRDGGADAGQGDDHLEEGRRRARPCGCRSRGSSPGGSSPGRRGRGWGSR